MRPRQPCCRETLGGFTLVELVMVIVVIGVLAVFALPALDLTTFRLAGLRR